jgi:hypothetical protein
MGASLSYYYFSDAIPFVAIDITMDREAALKKAGELSAQHNWGPQPYMQAALFELDAVARNYIELEAGGRKQLQEIIDNHQYELYTWRVRHMQEDNPHQAVIYFTPEGNWYGLQETLNEDSAGAILTKDEAVTLAQKTAQSFGISLASFNLVESSKKEARSKRIDHTFVYENAVKFGQAPLQLKIVVSGDRVTEITRSVKVPQEFIRRFEAIRANNNLLFMLGQGIIYIVFMFFGCIVALFLMARHSRLRLLAPMFFAAGLIILQIFATLNIYPLVLYSYKTNYSTTLFLTQFIIGLITASLGTFVVFALSLASGTELSKRAFPTKTAWRNFFNIRRAGSWHIIDLVGVGLLMATMHVCYVILFYAYSLKTLGWWIPTDTLFNPNILSSYFPTFSPFARALNAGVWEEFLFRAVPIGGGALIGSYFGRRNLGMWLGFIVQIVVFGIGHANYPGIPGYSRLIELVAPSVMFGLSYIYLGIIPGIISHWAYDFFWMSLPLLVAQTAESTLQRMIIVGVLFSPLVYVLVARYWHDEDEKDFEEDEDDSYEHHDIHHKEPLLSNTILRLLTVPLILIGVIGTYTIIQTPYNDTVLTITASQARDIATHYLGNLAINLTGYKPLVIVSEKPEPVQNYVQYVLGATISELNQKYRLNGLNGKTVAFSKPPRYSVRFAQFANASIEERAREYHVAIEGDGTIRRYLQMLPESEPKKSISEDEARNVIVSQMKQHNVTPSFDSFKEVSAVMTKLPHRHDWTFTFEHEHTPEIKARLVVKLAGDVIADIETTYLAPESYTRLFERDITLVQLIQAVAAVLMILILLCLYLYKPTRLSHWSRPATFIIAIASACALFATLNKFPLLMAGFNTTNPFTSQILSAISRILIVLLIRSILPIAALVFIIEQRYMIQFSRLSLLKLGIGFATGSVAYTLIGMLPILGVNYVVWPPHVTDAGAYIPGFSYFLRSIFQASLDICMLAGITSILSKIHVHRWILTLALSILTACLLYPVDFVPFITPYFLGYLGLVAFGIFLILELVAIDYPETIVPIIGTMYILESLRMIMHPTYPGLPFFAVLTLLVFAFIISFIHITKRKTK